MSKASRRRKKQERQRKDNETMTTFNSAMITPQKNPKEKCYTVQQAATFIGCDYSTLNKACHANRVVCHEIPKGSGNGNTFMIYESDLLEWDKTRMRKSAPSKASTELTVEELATELINRIQKAYDDGYKAGRRDQRDEMLNALKGVK